MMPGDEKAAREGMAVICALVNGVPIDEVFAQPRTWAVLREFFTLEDAAGVVNDIDDYRGDA